MNSPRHSKKDKEEEEEEEHSKPERAPLGYVFTVGEEVYVLDANEHDLWQAKIMKRLPDGHVVEYVDSSQKPEKIRRTRRILLRTARNDRIYKSQSEERSQVPPSSDSEPASKRPSKEKAPSWDPDGFIRAAWDDGIRDAPAFQASMLEKFAPVMDRFTSFCHLMNVVENPLFKLGGGIPEQDVREFWTGAKTQWLKIIGLTNECPSQEFVEKIAKHVKLPNQVYKNALNAVTWFFTPSTRKTIHFLQFCGFLAMFGPSTTAMRKLGNFLKCPEEWRGAVTYIDVSLLEDETKPADDVEMNSLSFRLAEGTTNVYNLIHVATGSHYLVDSDGNEYESWEHVLAAFPAPLPPEDEEEEDTPE
jgi:hypothetical protein